MSFSAWVKMFLSEIEMGIGMKLYIGLNQLIQLTSKHVVNQRVHPPHFLLILKTDRSRRRAKKTAGFGNVAHGPGYWFNCLAGLLLYSPWFAR